jgi:phosphoglycolate phosphatase
MRVKLVIFDWDGTLMDSAAKIINCLLAAIGDVGLGSLDRHAVRQIIGLSLHDAFNTLFPGASLEQHRELVERYRLHFLTTDRTAMQLFPGVLKHLQELCGRGYLLAVATGKGRRGLDQVLTDTDTSHLFVATRCADEAPSKPHPQMLLDILDQTGIEASESVMVGDTVFDLQMANQAGVHAVAVTYGMHDVTQLHAHDPLACLNSFPEVYAWILNQAA